MGIQTGCAGASDVPCGTDLNVLADALCVGILLGLAGEPDHGGFGENQEGNYVQICNGAGCGNHQQPVYLI